MWPLWLTSWLSVFPPTHSLFPGAIPDEGDVRHLYPVTQIVIGLDKHAHVVPYLLGWLENIDYPKNRLRITFYLLDREDPTGDQVSWWKESMSSLFASIAIVEGEANWLEAGLRSARLRRTSRVLLTTGNTLPMRSRLLKDLNSTAVVISALFDAASTDGVTNFDEVEDDYRERNVVERVKIDQAVLPMFVNIDRMDASYLTFDADNLSHYEGSSDPLEVFAESARRMGVELWIDNLKHHGFYIDESLEADARRRALRYLLADLVADDQNLPIPSQTVRPWVPEPHRWDVDKIYMINLNRRPERRAKMEKIFQILGVDATHWEATDGQDLPDNFVYELLPGYLDPFHNRPMKAGEIGCFLSHYRIWQDVVRLGLSRVIVFEDDLRFADDGLERIREVLEDLDGSKMEWDLIYLGRKKQADQEELWVPLHRHLSTVGYSYWTLGYILSNEGAHRLIDAKPLEVLLPVDEYLPIMFDKHPNKVWSSYFPNRNLRAFTIYPLAVFPQRYTHEEGYVSDTEDSAIVVEEVHEPKKPDKDELYSLLYGNIGRVTNRVTAGTKRSESARQSPPEMGCVWSSADLVGGGYRIKIIKKIAEGGFSQVLLCTDIDSGEHFAVKKISKHSRESEERIAIEISIHRQLLDVRNVVPLLAAITTDHITYLVFPFCKKGSIGDDLLRRRSSNDHLGQEQVVCIFHGLCSAVRAVHRLGYVHRDLKVANVLRADDGTPLLTDFGSAARVPIRIDNARDQQHVIDEAAELCSMPYRAPELFDCHIGTVITEAADLWSLGCCLYALCYFVSPFDLVYEKGNSVALAAQSPEKIQYPDTGLYNNRLLSVMQRLLVVDPSQRMPLDDVLSVMTSLEKGNSDRSDNSKIV
ncbi:hypothetical protein RB195_012271 [Necator americanus]|uniref:non-specific serine/threonine protein kinase n=1 Tax=Necator americanus TaxID=51031 RepID=A0ABR1D761_NECAM